MKEYLLLGLIACLSVTSLHASRGRNRNAKQLAGTYPIVLAHGILGFDDQHGPLNGALKYWGGMDRYLRKQGVEVLTPGKTALAGLELRAEQQRDQINRWMAAHNYSKVHIIGHSQGGLDTRYMISNKGMAGKVSTLTTVNAVHRGSPVADIALAVIPGWMKPSVAAVLNSLGRLVFGGKQNILAMAESLTTGYMNTFNQVTPNHGSVKYFSYGSHIKFPDPFQHPLMFILHPVTCLGGMSKGQGCSNDGVVPLSSQKWGSWKGQPSQRWYTTGVDHLQATNFQYTGKHWYDVEGYYLKMAKNAKANQQQTRSSSNNSRRSRRRWRFW